MNVFEWIQDVNAFGWSRLAGAELLELLQPFVRLGNPHRWKVLDDEEASKDSEPRVRDVVDWEVVLKSGADVRHHFDSLRRLPAWKDALVELLPSFTGLLQTAWDLMFELEGVTADYDLSYLHHPSIGDHPQNQHFKDWTILVDLCRDAWLETEHRNAAPAAAELYRWRQINFPIFRRLSLFAAAHTTRAITSDSALALLAKDDTLWSIETQYEALQLICFLAGRLSDEEADKLTKLILGGPPRALYRADLTDDKWNDLRDKARWLRLAKFNACHGHLSDEARGTLVTLITAHGFKRKPAEIDEFPSFTVSSSDSGWTQRVNLPTDQEALVAALPGRPDEDVFYEDNWREIVENHFDAAAGALVQLARRHEFPTRAWREALQTLTGEKIARDAWNRLHATLANASTEVLNSLAESLTFWLRELANQLPLSDDVAFFTLIDHVAAAAVLSMSTAARDISISQAINHPIGHLIEGLIRWWYRTAPRVGGRLPHAIRERFTAFLKSPQGAPVARTTLGSHLNNLFVVDPDWTTEYLLPHFRWGEDSTIARAVWQAYLGHPTISEELIGAFKQDFLETASHYELLGEYSEQYASLLAIAFLEIPEAFTIQDMRTTLGRLGPTGLAAAATRVSAGLASAGERREQYWTNRARPLIERAWPKSASLRSGGESCALAHIAIRAGREFPDALKTLRPLLRKARECPLIASELARTKIPTDEPLLVLQLLDTIIDVNHPWPPHELRALINTIGKSAPAVKETPEFRRLQQYVEQFATR